MPKVFPLPPLPPPTLQAAVENQKPPQSKTLHEAEGEGGEEAIVEKAEVAEAAEVAKAGATVVAANSAKGGTTRIGATKWRVYDETNISTRPKQKRNKYQFKDDEGHDGAGRPGRQRFNCSQLGSLGEQNTITRTGLGSCEGSFTAGHKERRSSEKDSHVRWKFEEDTSIVFTRIWRPPKPLAKHPGAVARTEEPTGPCDTNQRPNTNFEQPHTKDSQAQQEVRIADFAFLKHENCRHQEKVLYAMGSNSLGPDFQSPRRPTNEEQVERSLAAVAQAQSSNKIQREDNKLWPRHQGEPLARAGGKRLAEADGPNTEGLRQDTKRFNKGSRVRGGTLDVGATNTGMEEPAQAQEIHGSLSSGDSKEQAQGMLEFQSFEQFREEDPFQRGRNGANFGVDKTERLRDVFGSEVLLPPLQIERGLETMVRDKSTNRIGATLVTNYKSILRPSRYTVRDEALLRSDSSAHAVGQRGKNVRHHGRLDNSNRVVREDSSRVQVPGDTFNGFGFRHRNREIPVLCTLHPVEDNPELPEIRPNSPTLRVRSIRVPFQHDVGSSIRQTKEDNSVQKEAPASSRKSEGFFDSVFSGSRRNVRGSQLDEVGHSPSNNLAVFSTPLLHESFTTRQTKGRNSEVEKKDANTNEISCKRYSPTFERLENQGRRATSSHRERRGSTRHWGDIGFDEGVNGFALHEVVQVFEPKQKRAKSGHSDSQVFHYEAQFAEHGNSDPVGQFDEHIIHERKDVSHVSGGRVSGFFTMGLGSQEHSLRRGSHSRNTDGGNRSGQFVKNQRIFQRMDIESGGLLVDHEMGKKCFQQSLGNEDWGGPINGNSRHDGVAVQHKTPNICVVRRVQHGIVHRRAQRAVEREKSGRETLGLSPSEHDTESGVKDQAVGRRPSSSNGNTVLEEQDLVGGPDGNVNLSSNALVPDKEPDGTATGSNIHSIKIPQVGFDIMDYCTAKLRGHGYTPESIGNLFDHYHNKTISKFYKPIRSWLEYCRTLEGKEGEIKWNYPSSMAVANWFCSEGGPESGKSDSYNRTYKRGPALFITIVNNTFPAEAFPQVEVISLQKMILSGRRKKAVKAKPKEPKYNAKHFLHPRYVYDYFMKNPMDKNLTHFKKKKWLRMKLIVLLRLDSLRRSGCLSRIPMHTVDIRDKWAAFKVYEPKGVHKVVSASKGTERIGTDKYSSELKIFSASKRNANCCTVRALRSYVEATLEDRKHAYDNGVTVQGSVEEHNADFLFIGLSLHTRSIKKGMTKTKNDNVMSFRKISSQVIAKDIQSFFSDFLFPSLPVSVKSKDLLLVKPHVLRHWGSSNFFMRFRIGLEDESAIKEYVLNLAGWVDVNEFRRTYDIRPFKFYKNARGLESLKNISDKLRANDLSE